MESFRPLFGYRILGILQSNWLPFHFQVDGSPVHIDSFWLNEEKTIRQIQSLFVQCAIGFWEFRNRTGFHFPIFALPSFSPFVQGLRFCQHRFLLAKAFSNNQQYLQRLTLQHTKAKFIYSKSFIIRFLIRSSVAKSYLFIGLFEIGKVKYIF